MSPYQGTLGSSVTFVGAGRACAQHQPSPDPGSPPLGLYRQPKTLMAWAFTCVSSVD